MVADKMCGLYDRGLLFNAQYACVALMRRHLFRVSVRNGGDLIELDLKVCHQGVSFVGQ